jgi:hypothetical protein
MNEKGFYLHLTLSEPTLKEKNSHLAVAGEEG